MPRLFVSHISSKCNALTDRVTCELHHGEASLGLSNLHYRKACTTTLLTIFIFRALLRLATPHVTLHDKHVTLRDKYILTMRYCSMK